MTMNEKIAELEAQGYIKNDSYEIYENAADGWTVQVFTSSWSFEEYNFDKEGNPIDAWETGIGGRVKQNLLKKCLTNNSTCDTIQSERKKKGNEKK